MEPYPVLKALVICGAGGVLFSVLRAPLPSMLGPGGIAEMCVTAKVLQLGVPLVTAHVTRVIILVTATAPMFRLAQHLRRSWRT